MPKKRRSTAASLSKLLTQYSPDASDDDSRKPIAQVEIARKKTEYHADDLAGDVPEAEELLSTELSSSDKIDIF